MTEIGEQASSGEGRDRTVVMIVLGLAAVCLCGVAVGVVALGGVAMFGITSQTILGSQIGVQPTPLPAIPMPTSLPATNVVNERPVGETLDIPDEGRKVVPDGSPVSYNSDPPTSGPHYETWLDPGFYADAEPDGYVVTNLEHGYVVIWYDCSALTDADCLTLQNNIEGLIKASGVAKLIGMPREGMPHPIALTTWTKLMFLDDFDPELIGQFIDDNAGNAPEPEAP